MNNLEFGNYLREKRKEKKLTIRQLDTYSGVSHSYISQVERGNRGIPSPDVLKKLSKPLGVDYEELMIKAGHIDEIRESLPSNIRDNVDEEFVELVNDLFSSFFSPEDMTADEWENLKKLNFSEKVELLTGIMHEDDKYKSTNKKLFDSISFLTGRNDRIKIDLTDNSIIDQIDMFYDGMELTREEKLEFMAIAQGIFSARQALKGKH